MDAIYGFIDAGGIAHGPEFRKEFGNIQEGNSEIKNVFSADVSSSQWEKSTLLYDQSIKWTKARVYVYSDPVLCLEQNARQKVE